MIKGIFTDFKITWETFTWIYYFLYSHSFSIFNERSYMIDVRHQVVQPQRETEYLQYQETQTSEVMRYLALF